MSQRNVSTKRGAQTLERASGLLVLTGILAIAPAVHAQTTLGPISIGAGLRTSFGHTETDGADSTDKFNLDSVRLYVNGPVIDKVKFMFNTEYDGATNKIGVLDAVARFEFSPKFNLWAGRFLPPSDRSNLYGPYYAHNWSVYTDGIQDGYPFVFQGRDNGVMYWGDFAKKIKVSVGAFDGGSATGNHKVLGAARVQIDFWDKEDGYYLNGTYYGDKNLLAIGGATQYQDGHTATTVDFLMERKVGKGGAFTIESEYSNYNRLGGYDSRYAKSEGAYVLAAYLFPKQVGVGKFEVLGKYAKAEFTHGGTEPNYHQKTTEVNFNYVIKQFNCRVMSFFRDTRFNREKANTWQAGLGLQVQM